MLRVHVKPIGAPGQATVLRINTYTADHTLSFDDLGALVSMNVGAANTVVIPANATNAFPIGSHIQVHQLGSGSTTVSPAAGVTIRGASNVSLSARYSVINLLKVAVDEWVSYGDVSVGSMGALAEDVGDLEDRLDIAEPLLANHETRLGAAEAAIAESEGQLGELANLEAVAITSGTAGTSAAYTAVSPVIPSNGSLLLFKPHVDSAAAPTLAVVVDGVAQSAIEIRDATDVALPATGLPAGREVLLRRTANRFLVLTGGWTTQANDYAISFTDKITVDWSGGTISFPGASIVFGGPLASINITAKTLAFSTAASARMLLYYDVTAAAYQLYAVNAKPVATATKVFLGAIYINVAQKRLNPALICNAEYVYTTGPNLDARVTYAPGVPSINQDTHTISFPEGRTVYFNGKSSETIPATVVGTHLVLSGDNGRKSITYDLNTGLYTAHPFNTPNIGANHIPIGVVTTTNANSDPHVLELLMGGSGGGGGGTGTSDTTELYARDATQQAQIDELTERLAAAEARLTALESA